MPSTQTSVQCVVRVVLLDQHYLFGVRTLLRVQKVFGRRVVSVTVAMIAAVDSLVLT